jgi:hypothetical protein
MSKTIELTTKLEEQELKTIQELNAHYSKLKLALGELKLNEVDIIEKVKEVKALFVVEEKKLVEKYGADSVINLQTGEVTKKE